jgi:hypothetical protein
LTANTEPVTGGGLEGDADERVVGVGAGGQGDDLAAGGALDRAPAEIAAAAVSRCTPSA